MERRRLPFLYPLAAISLSVFSSYLSAETDWTRESSRIANLVLGWPNFEIDPPAAGTASNLLSSPEDVALDPTSGKVFVADTGNSRVLRFASAAALANDAHAEAVFGQDDFISNDVASPPTQFSIADPFSLVVDEDGRLWVSDRSSNRILRFDNASSKPTGAAADGVLGQANFTDNGSGTFAGTLGSPHGIAIDDLGNLWVADYGNRRVLLFGDAAEKANGALADKVQGQPDFETVLTSVEPQDDLIRSPYDVAISPDGKTLYIADNLHSRVLRHDDVLTKTDGAPADGVFGQDDFTSRVQDTGANRLDIVTGVSVDPNGILWISDRGNNRLLGFQNASTRTPGAAADFLIGQNGFDERFNRKGPEGFYLPTGVFAQGDEALWVADSELHRITRFGPGDGVIERFQPDLWIGKKANRQKGNNIYNRNAKGQTVSVKTSRRTTLWFTAQNDGSVADRLKLRATRGNALLDLRYIRTPGGNTTGTIVRGRAFTPALNPGQTTRYRVQISGTRRSTNRTARKTLTVTSNSTAGGALDRAKATVVKAKR